MKNNQRKGKVFCRHSWLHTGNGCTYIEFGTGLMRVNHEMICQKCGKVKMSNDIPKFKR